MWPLDASKKLDNTNEIVAASHKSLADEVMAKLPAGYEQMLGRRFETGLTFRAANGRSWRWRERICVMRSC